MTIPAVIKVKPLNSAIIAGLKSDDVITKVGGKSVTDFKGLMAEIEQSPGRPLALDVLRDGKPMTVTLTPETQTLGNGKPDRGTAGIEPAKGTEQGPARVIVRPDYAGVLAGLKTNDIVQRIDSQTITDFNQLSMAIAKSAGRELSFAVLRDGAPVTVKVTPQVQTVPDGFGGFDTRGIVGIEPGGDRSKIPVVYPSIPGALMSGVDQTWQVISTTLGYFYDVANRQQSTDKIGGIATVIDVSNKVATFGFGPLVQLIALLSVSIGLLNLFPIPLLDGGHLMYYAYEAVRGRPLSEQTQELGFRIGLAVVSMLMVLALWNDRLRIIRWFS
jgi:membrane-associated protease RseP (regulator of RpoE activity)